MPCRVAIALYSDTRLVREASHLPGCTTLQSVTDYWLYTWQSVHQRGMFDVIMKINP